jgi:type I restriction enzyme S subunit
VVEFLDHMRRPVTAAGRQAGPYPYFGANGQQGWIDGYLFDEPLVLLAEDGGHFEQPERGIAYRIEGKSWVNNHAHVLRPRDGVDLGYLSRVLGNLDVAQYVTGTTRAKLTKARAAQIQFPLPPLPEQQRIANILDCADDLRTKRRAALAKLDTLTQSIFLDMFGDAATNPMVWPKRPLGAACLAINDCPHTTPRWTGSGVICLRTSNLGVGRWVWDDTRYVTEAAYHERSKRGYIEPGDIVLSREGTVGVAAQVSGEMRVCLGQRLVQVRPMPAVLGSQYLLQYLLQVLSPRRISRVMVGSTSRHLNLSALRGLPVPVPPLALQESFADRCTAREALRARSSGALHELDFLFASLQHRAFRGEL